MASQAEVENEDAKSKPPPAEPSTSSVQAPKRPAPAQERMRTQLANINQALLLHIGRDEPGLLTDDDRRRMKRLKEDKETIKCDLKKEDW